MPLQRHGSNEVSSVDGWTVQVDRLASRVRYQDASARVELHAEQTGGPTYGLAISLDGTPTDREARELHIRVTTGLAALGLTPLWVMERHSTGWDLHWANYWRDVYAEVVTRIAAEVP